MYIHCTVHIKLEYTPNAIMYLFQAISICNEENKPIILVDCDKQLKCKLNVFILLFN